MFLTSLKMISMIYMPGLCTCLLLEPWIAGSLDRWIAGSLDRWIAPLCSLCSRPHNYFTFLVYLNYTRTPHKVKHFFDNFLKIPCRTMNSSISPGFLNLDPHP